LLHKFARHQNRLRPNSTDKLFALYDQLYADFSSRRELHVYEPQAKKIDFAGEMFFNQQR